MKTYPIFIAVIIVFLTLSATAQIDKMQERMDDEMVALDDGLLTMRFYDAETGNPISNAMVTITGLGNFTSDGLGRVRFPIPEKDGTYVAHVECGEYIPVDFPLEIVAETIIFNRFSLSKNMPIGQLRVVLEWDKKPADLDAHFVNEGEYHISYRKSKVSDDGIARLDRDDRGGFGPETITVKNIDKGDTYSYYVHNYTHKDKSESKRLSKSKANVKVYGNNSLLKIFQIPVDTEGVYWQVFTITDGQINDVNVVSNTAE